MIIFFGQIDHPKPNIEKLIDRINHGFPNNYDVSVKEIQIVPCSWAIALFLPWPASDYRKEHHTMDLIYNIAQTLGTGTYYFRGARKENCPKDLWDLDPTFFPEKIGALFGIPMSISYDPRETYIDIHFSWVSHFLARNAQKPFEGLDFLQNNPANELLFNLSQLYTLHGEWKFRLLDLQAPCN